MITSKNYISHPKILMKSAATVVFVRKVSQDSNFKKDSFYFTNKTTSPLCKTLGNKLQECVAASSMQALIHLLPIFV